MKPWDTKSVRELQLYLKDRGVTYTNELKASLVQLCLDAESMGLEIDPDGLHEDRAEILAKKLVIGDVTLQCPTLLTNYTNNIAIIPLLSICDLYSYLMSFDDYTLATFRDVEKMGIWVEVSWFAINKMLKLKKNDSLLWNTVR